MMDLSKWPNADDLLDQALALPARERRVYLRTVAGHDPALLAALESVLIEADTHDGFLDPGGAIERVTGRAVDPAGDERHALEPGTRVGRYDVVAVIGRGGMGEVYRARDLELGRDVALKVLPRRFAGHPDRTLRLRREAQVLASLSHPGIATIHGLETGGPDDVLVMELVEGETLADRLASGPLPLEDALLVARAIVEALEAAHRGGVVHRDLKPANIKVRPDNSVKVLDFGIAKALVGDGEPGAPSVDLTGASGRVFGTVSYMSPEQVRGRIVDQRADVWAFGCVLFEMLTGVKAFAGDSPTDVVARVLEREPAFGLLPPQTPPPVRRLIRRCLEKDPRRRLGYIGDALLELDDAAMAAALEPMTDGPAQPEHRWWPAVLAAGIALAVGAGLGAWLAGWTQPAGAVVRFPMAFPEGYRPVLTFQPLLALSPDGQTVAFKANRDGVSRLFRRDLDVLDAQPIEGTENATTPFFSPDGQWLAFDSDGVLKRVSLSGGPPLTICDAPGGATASWGPGDTIVFATNTSRVLMSVPVMGGQPVPMTALDTARGETSHLLPQVLPDGRSVLFTIQRGAQREIALRSIEGGETTILIEGTHGRYADGYLVYWRDQTLWAIRFDLSRRSVSGSPLPVATNVAETDNTVVHYAVSGTGALAYLPSSIPRDLRMLVWIDRAGRRTPVPLDPGPIDRLALSPDGRRIALSVRRNDNTDIWIADESRGTLSRLTVEPTIETMPLWTPDGTTVVFRSERQGPGIWRRPGDGSGEIERLTTTDGPIHSPYSWTPDGKTLLLALFHSYGHQEIASVTPPDPTVHVLLRGNFAQLDPQVSPDGRFMAYQSDESGRFEVYVRPFPDVQANRWQVSTRGGMAPRWHPSGGELFFFNGEGLSVVSVQTDSGFSVGPPTSLFELDPIGSRLGPDYDVAPDGGRFLFSRSVAEPAGESTPRMVYVQHWLDGHLDPSSRTAVSPR